MPRKPSIADQLEAARAELERVKGQTADAGARRSSRLLAGDAATAIATLDAELAALEHAARTERDRVALLEQQAEKQAAEQRLREREGLIKRAEAKFKARDESLAKIAELSAQLTKEFRKAISLGKEIDSAWAWSMSDRNRLLVTGTAIQVALSHEFFRVSHVPFWGGRPGEISEPSLPGSKCSRPVDWLGFPEREPALTEVARAASALGSSLMRTGRDTPEPMPAANGAAAAKSAATANGSEPPPRTAADGQLAGLLKRQAELAEDVSPEGEAAYNAVVAEIAALQS